MKTPTLQTVVKAWPSFRGSNEYFRNLYGGRIIHVQWPFAVMLFEHDEHRYADLLHMRMGRAVSGRRKVRNVHSLAPSWVYDDEYDGMLARYSAVCNTLLAIQTQHGRIAHNCTNREKEHLSVASSNIQCSWLWQTGVHNGIRNAQSAINKWQEQLQQEQLGTSWLDSAEQAFQLAL